MFWISKSIAPVRKSIWAHAILINHKLFANINYSSQQIIRTSSLAIVMLSVTFEKTVGSMKYPTFPCRWPPHSNLAPSFWPASIYLKTLLNISSSTCGPRIIFDVNVMCSKVTKYYWSCVCVLCTVPCSVLASNGLPTLRARANLVASATKASKIFSCTKVRVPALKNPLGKKREEKENASMSETSADCLN